MIGLIKDKQKSSRFDYFFIINCYYQPMKAPNIIANKMNKISITKKLFPYPLFPPQQHGLVGFGQQLFIYIPLLLLNKCT